MSHARPTASSRPPLTAAIMAGGHARRLNGLDKSALTIGSRRIIDRQLDVLREIADEIVIVAPSTDRFAALGLPVVEDIRPDAGPLGALYTALQRSGAPTVLAVACDMPFLQAPFLAHVVEAGRAADVAVPRTADGYHPLCASYSKACAEPIRRHLDAGRLKMTGFYVDVRVREIGTSEIARFDPHDMMLFNVNTPDDYERARAWQERAAS